MKSSVRFDLLPCHPINQTLSKTRFVLQRQAWPKGQRQFRLFTPLRERKKERETPLLLQATACAARKPKGTVESEPEPKPKPEPKSMPKSKPKPKPMPMPMPKLNHANLVILQYWILGNMIWPTNWQRQSANPNPAAINQYGRARQTLLR